MLWKDVYKRQRGLLRDAARDRAGGFGGRLPLDQLDERRARRVDRRAGARLDLRLPRSAASGCEFVSMRYVH